MEMKYAAGGSISLDHVIQARKMETVAEAGRLMVSEIDV